MFINNIVSRRVGASVHARAFALVLPLNETILLSFCHSEERSDEESGFSFCHVESGFLALFGMTTTGAKNSKRPVQSDQLFGTDNRGNRSSSRQ